GRCIVTFLHTVTVCNGLFTRQVLHRDMRTAPWCIGMFLGTVTGRPVTFLHGVTGRCDTFLDGIHLGGHADDLGVINQALGGGTQLAMLDKTIEGGAGDAKLARRFRLGESGHGRAYAFCRSQAARTRSAVAMKRSTSSRVSA